MINKKAQTVGIGAIIMVAITIIVGAIFLQASAQNVGETTNTVALVNDTNTAGANGASFFITEWRAISSVVIHNASGGEVIAAGNYTVTNNVVNDGALAIQITVDDAEYESIDWNVSGTVQPLTYSDDGGTRALAGLIIVMFALALAVVALVPTVRSEVLKQMGR